MNLGGQFSFFSSDLLCVFLNAADIILRIYNIHTITEHVSQFMKKKEKIIYSQVPFIYIAILTIQIVSKQLSNIKIGQ